jgi:DNA-binding NtrC family response regulator
LKIIFIDSSSIILDTLQMLMKNFSDSFDTSFYQNPADIVNMIELGSLEFDILFSEIIFKNLDGINLIKRVKESKKFKEKRVAIITKEYNKERLNTLNSFGVNDIFTKSIYSDHLEIFLSDVIAREIKVI